MQTDHVLAYLVGRCVSQVRTECAWCGRLLRQGPEPTTHSICAACAFKQNQRPIVRARARHTRSLGRALFGRNVG